MAEPLLTQIEVEQRMYYGGIKRAEAMMQRAEETGNADRNPYAKTLFADYVLPLSQAITDGSNLTHAAAVLLADVDHDTAAFLAVRAVVSAILSGGESVDHRTLAYVVGKTINNELVLGQIADLVPELYHTLANDLGRRLSKDERHRMTVMKMQAKEAGVEVVEWPVGARDQVGMYLLGLMEVAGLLDIEPASGPQKGKFNRGIVTPTRAVYLSQGVMDTINEIKAYTAVSMPVYGPNVAPPRPWVKIDDGGFYTKEMIRNHRYLISGNASARHLYRSVPMPTVLAAANALQETAWQVNKEVFEVIMSTAALTRGTKEIVSLNSLPKPDKPQWLTPEIDKKALTEAQAKEFKAWKRTMAEWHTQRKLLGTRYGRFYSATRSAEMFKDYPAIYFVYFADSRGRLYPMTYGLNPQGSDLQKSMLRFAKGMPVTTPDAIKWFHVQGANKWGFDKATLEQRQAWVVERQDLILRIAADPLNNDEWKQADSPLQFLAWAFEYKRWVEDRDGSFLSHLPISMDGSCNGLQNLSALLRDEVGGQATNLTANETMQDIYQRVADAAVLRLRSATRTPENESYIERWLTHGISRKVVKRSVMTTPYGVTRDAAEKYVITDYLEEVDNPFDKTEYRAAAKVLMESVWPAIGDVVVKGREAMTWLKKSAHAIIKHLPADADPIIEWISPSGFVATQSYFKSDDHRINSRLHGPIKIKVVSESDDPDVYKHASGLAPNFVHSMDAAHLHLTTSQCARRGIDALAMIHDDYGTHAANAQALFEIIRSEFVAMYEGTDPIMALALRYPEVPKPPKPGTLDIREVLRSTYFFS